MQCLLIEHIMKIMMLTGAILIGMLTGAIFYAESHMKANNYLCEAVLKGRTFPFVRHTGHSVTPLILFTIASPQALQTNASGCLQLLQECVARFSIHMQHSAAGCGVLLCCLDEAEIFDLYSSQVIPFLRSHCRPSSSIHGG